MHVEVLPNVSPLSQEGEPRNSKATMQVKKTQDQEGGATVQVQVPLPPAPELESGCQEPQASSSSLLGSGTASFKGGGKGGGQRLAAVLPSAAESKFEFKLLTIWEVLDFSNRLKVYMFVFLFADLRSWVFPNQQQNSSSREAN